MRAAFRKCVSELKAVPVKLASPKEQARFVFEIKVEPSYAVTGDLVFAVCKDGVPRRYYRHCSTTRDAREMRDSHGNSFFDSMVEMSVEGRRLRDQGLPPAHAPSEYLESTLARLKAVVMWMREVCNGTRRKRSELGRSRYAETATLDCPAGEEEGSFLVAVAVQYLEDGFKAFVHEVYDDAVTYWRQVLSIFSLP